MSWYLFIAITIQARKDDRIFSFSICGQMPVSVFFHVYFITVMFSTGLVLTETEDLHLLSFLQHLCSLWEVPRLLSGNFTELTKFDRTTGQDTMAGDNITQPSNAIALSVKQHIFLTV